MATIAVQHNFLAIHNIYIAVQNDNVFGLLQVQKYNKL